MLKLETLAGDEIHQTINRAIATATRDQQVTFAFNGVTVLVAFNSDCELIYRDWNRGLKGYLGENPTVGPYPSPQLSEDELASDDKIRVEKRAKRIEREARMAEEDERKAAGLSQMLADAPQIELVDQDGWHRCHQNNSDPYGSAVVRYAETWARLMQVRIANGESVAECAKETSRLADTDGITGFMHGAAVSMLSHAWKHGEELRRWHNVDTQIDNEGDKANESGGVLNPALLSVGK